MVRARGGEERGEHHGIGRQRSLGPAIERRSGEDFGIGVGGDDGGATGRNSGLVELNAPSGADADTGDLGLPCDLVDTILDPSRAPNRFCRGKPGEEGRGVARRSAERAAGRRRLLHERDGIDLAVGKGVGWRRRRRGRRDNGRGGGHHLGRGRILQEPEEEPAKAGRNRDSHDQQELEVFSLHRRSTPNFGPGFSREPS